LTSFVSKTYLYSPLHNNTMDCQICFETVSDIYKVSCDSPVDHVICFDCETKWRAKMPIRNGTRVLTCPTCRQPESDRTMDSLQRELSMMYVSRQEVTTDTIIHVLSRLQPESLRFLVSAMPALRDAASPAVNPSVRAARPVQAAAEVQVVSAEVLAQAAQAPTRPTQAFCASGRNCRTRSRLHTRTKTHMRCRACQTVPCCANCRVCTTCQPLYSLATA
jgi:hypothetical protein